VLITFESDWRKAKRLLATIAAEKAEHLSQGAEAQIRRAAMRYLIFFRNLTPIVYTSVRESGVLLTLRYIVKPRERRRSEEVIWEAILDAFGEHADLALAYPTTRFYSAREPHESAAGREA
jgi:small-conductance mechanosensitive channel